MVIRLPYLIQDRRVAEVKSMSPIEFFEWNPNPELQDSGNWEALDQPDVFLDGPVSTRVALLDFNESTGQLEPPTVLKKYGDTAQYAVVEDLNNRQFQAVSTFSTVLKTLQGFETSDVLGRRIEWSSPGTQLLVVPFAGEWANAFYERESASLQFFSFADENGDPVHSSQSFDIVAHETGHAILDAIAPSLYDTITPESLALHEAIADLTALVMAVTSDRLRDTLLEQTGGSISGRNAFTWIAEEFGRARGGNDSAPYLRSLANELKMDKVDSAEPHDLSQVLSGALFETLSWIFERRKKQSADGEIKKESSIKSLIVANWIFRRLAFRALDYLPPGEISFSDYGRAIWAADRNSNPASPEYREHVADVFEKRGIVAGKEELDTEIPETSILQGVDLHALANDDWLAYDFANKHRDLLKIPESVRGFRVLDRLEVTKVTYRTNDQKVRYRELLFKVGWEATEDNPVAGLPAKRGVSFGTTLAIDCDTCTVAGIVTTNPQVTAVDQSNARTLRLERLLDSNALDISTPGSVSVTTSGGVLRVTGGGRSLHLASGYEFELREAEEDPA